MRTHEEASLEATTRSLRILSTTLALLLLAAACRVGPDYVKPAAPTTDPWSTSLDSRLSAEPTDLANWWTVFGDPVLDSLMRRAIEENLDLHLATARVREARALAGRARAELGPDVDGHGITERRRFSERGPVPAPRDPESNLYDNGFDARWEIDVFGGTQRSIEAADADLAATEEHRREVLVSLLGEVARAYVDLRGYQSLASVIRRNVESTRSTLALTQARLRGGLATELDVSRAQALLSATEASLPPVEAEVRVEMHRLAVLVGARPGEMLAELEPESRIPIAPERILVGLPSELLERRPDVRRHERELAAATARTGVAIADRYPKFSLSAAFGIETASPSEMADAASRAWSVGTVARFPLFDAGRRARNVEAADARTEQALHAYRQSMLVALEEVENAMVRYLREWDHHRSLSTALDADRRSVALADDLYRKGLTSFLDVLDAERRLHESEMQMARSDASAAKAVVALFKALGGGWQTES